MSELNINPQNVIQHLSNEIARLNLELAISKAALQQTLDNQETNTLIKE